MPPGPEADGGDGVTALTLLYGLETPSAVHVHTPCWHDACVGSATPMVQSLPHLPQLSLSVSRLEHELPHSVVPLGHVAGGDTQHTEPAGQVPPWSATATRPASQDAAHGANAPLTRHAPPSRVASGLSLGDLCSGVMAGDAHVAVSPHDGSSPGSTFCTAYPKLLTSTGGHGTVLAMVESSTNQKVDPS